MKVLTIPCLYNPGNHILPTYYQREGIVEGGELKRNIEIGHTTFSGYR